MHRIPNELHLEHRFLSLRVIFMTMVTKQCQADWETDICTPPVLEDAAPFAFQRHRCIKFWGLRAQNFRAPLVLNCKKGSSSWRCKSTKQVYENQSPADALENLAGERLQTRFALLPPQRAPKHCPVYGVWGILSRHGFCLTRLIKHGSPLTSGICGL